MLQVDLCVIGAGAGGLSAAAGAVQMGASVALVEAGKMGGDCLNYGCVPSKALLAAAKAAAHIRDGDQLGVSAASIRITYATAMTHVADTIAAIAPHDSEARFRDLGVKVIRGHARFISRRAVQVARADAQPEEIRARRFIIATGARPVIPPIPGLAELPYLTNETLFDLRAAPEHLLVLGGGPIGVEMAQAHRRLGSKVTLIEAERILAREDSDAVASLRTRLRGEGVEIVEGQAATFCGPVAGAPGSVEVTLADGRRLVGSHILVATGRRPALEDLGLEAAGIHRDRAGRLMLGPGLRCRGNRRVYALGDAASAVQFTHVAGYHAGVVLRQVLLALPARARIDHIPRVTYCDPELAQIGLTEAEARRAYGDAVEVIALPMAANDRARADAREDGLIKLVVRRGRVIGVTILGASAGEMLAPWSLMVANRMKLRALSASILPYPTLSELSKAAVGAYFSRKLFDNPMVTRAVSLVQHLIP